MTTFFCPILYSSLKEIKKRIELNHFEGTLASTGLEPSLCVNPTLAYRPKKQQYLLNSQRILPSGSYLGEGKLRRDHFCLSHFFFSLLHNLNKEKLFLQGLFEIFKSISFGAIIYHYCTFPSLHFQKGSSCIQQTFIKHS